MISLNRHGGKKGQMRILETIIAAAIIFIVFSAAFLLIRSSETITPQETIDLNKLGYNVLHRIMESRTIEETLEKSTNGPEYLKIVIQKFLPSGIYFSLTIYNCTGNLEMPFQPNPWIIGNAQIGEIAESREVGYASAIYTSKTGSIYYLVLNIARAGQG